MCEFVTEYNISLNVDGINSCKVSLCNEKRIIEFARLSFQTSFIRFYFYTSKPFDKLRNCL